VSGLKDVALPPHQIVREPSGLTLIAIERRGVPLFHARITFPAGASRDPAGKAGLACFTGDLLRRGTGRRDAHGVDDLVEGMGAHLGIETSADETALGLTVPFELAGGALDALLEVALGPTFPEEEVGSSRRRVLAELQADLDEPSSVAGRAGVVLGYGDGHPYGHPASGHLATVEAFTRADCAAFHAGSFQQGGAVLALCGSASPAALLAIARERLAKVSWPAGAALPVSAIPPVVQASGPALRAVVVHKPDSTQAQIRIVSAGMSRREPGWAAAFLANTALGGGFTSVLVDAIRVDRGLSYSVSSRLSMNRHAGLSVFASFTKNETLRELIDVALEKMHGYARTGPSLDALAKSKQYLAGLFPFGLEGHEALAEQLADAVLDETGLSRLETYRSSILAATPEEVLAVAKRLSPAREGAQIILVGDGEVAQKALAGLCAVQVVELERFA
jgi:zinc protease